VAADWHDWFRSHDCGRSNLHGSLGMLPLSLYSCLLCFGDSTLPIANVLAAGVSKFPDRYLLPQLIDCFSPWESFLTML